MNRDAVQQWWGLMMSAGNVASSDRCREAFGIVQMSCGLHVRNFRHQGKRPDAEELKKADFEQIDGELKNSFDINGANRFVLDNLSFSPELKTMQHTWLGEWSRHEALDIPGIFFEAEGSGSAALPFPEALKWRDRRPETAPFRTYVRVQRALDEPACHDWNDRVIRQQGSADGPDERTRSLCELRDFFAWLYAQRRSAIFASNLSERIYHIWLPAGLLSHRPGDQERGGPLVILPLVTMVRRPSQLEWRHTIGVSMIFVPVCCEPGQPLSPRPLVQDDSLELKHLVRSLEGGSTRVLAGANTVLRLDECPLRDYVTAATGLSRAPGLVEDMRSKVGDWEGTRRQWIELFATIGADSVGSWDQDPATHKRRLADAMLRSLRLTTIWSVMLAGEGLDCLEDRQGRQWPPLTPAEGDVTAAGFPAWAAGALDILSAPGSPPGPEDRIDDVSCSDIDYMTWRIPRRRCLLTVMGMAHEHFPGYSMLATSGWIGHMLVGAASASETMLELAIKTSQPVDISKRAKAAYEFIVELEEMYDLDVTWLMYAQFFRNIRRKLGIDQQYTGIRERVSLLARYTEVQETIKMAEERSRTERDNFYVGLAAAMLAIIIISLTAFGSELSDSWRGALIGLSVLLVLGVGIFIRRRDLRDKRRAPSA